MHCQFITTARGCKCERCGRVVRGHNGVNLIADCRLPCVHLGEAVGFVKVECQTCEGQKIVDQPAHRCAVLNRCLPKYQPRDPAKWQARPESEIYHLCWGCEAFEPLPPAPPAE